MIARRPKNGQHEHFQLPILARRLFAFLFESIASWVQQHQFQRDMEINRTTGILFLLLLPLEEGNKRTSCCLLHLFS